MARARVYGCGGWCAPPFSSIASRTDGQPTQSVTAAYTGIDAAANPASRGDTMLVSAHPRRIFSGLSLAPGVPSYISAMGVTLAHSCLCLTLKPDWAAVFTQEMHWRESVERRIQQALAATTAAAPTGPPPNGNTASPQLVLPTTAWRGAEPWPRHEAAAAAAVPAAVPAAADCPPSGTGYSVHQGVPSRPLYQTVGQ